MLEPIYKNKFRKEYVLALKRGIKPKEIDSVLSALIKEENWLINFEIMLLLEIIKDIESVMLRTTTY